MSVLAVPRSIARSLENQPKIELRTTNFPLACPVQAWMPQPGPGPNTTPGRGPNVEEFSGGDVWVRPTTAARHANRGQAAQASNRAQLRTEKAVKYDIAAMLEGIRRYQYSWQVQVTFAFLAIIMAFWGFGGGGLFNTVHPVATVNGRQILGDQVDREATQYPPDPATDVRRQRARHAQDHQSSPGSGRAG